MINHNNISEKIKYYRKKNQLSQDELSKRSGIHVSTIKKYECGIRNPKPAQLMKIAAALGISNNELLSYDISYQKEVASLWVKLHQEDLITLDYKTDADGQAIPESISISRLSPEIQKAIAQALESAKNLAKAEAVSAPAAKEPSAPAQKEKPAQAEKPVQKAKPVQAEKPVREEKPAQAEKPVQKAKEAPEKKPVSAEKPAPVVKPAPAEKSAPVVKPAPAEKPAPAAKPQEEKAAPKEKPVQKEQPAQEEKAPAAKAPESLDGTVGTGRIISKNMELFRFKFNSTMKFNGQDCLTFDWTYNKQGGIAIIRKTPEGEIEDTSSLTCKKNKGSFRHPLSIQKDHSLSEVFEKMLASRERFLRK